MIMAVAVLIFAATVPIVALIVAWASHRFRRISKRIQNSMGDVTHVASEAVSGYREVRIFGGQTYERDRFVRSSQYNRRQNLKMTATKVSSTQVIQFLSNLCRDTKTFEELVEILFAAIAAAQTGEAQ